MSNSINLDDVKEWTKAYEETMPGDMLKIKKLLEETNGNSRILVIGAKLDPGDVHQPHYHDNATVIVYGLKGIAIATIDGRELEVRPNTLIYIPPKAIHKFVNKSREVWECIAVAIGPKDLPLENMWISQP
jgi:quercetin dioxygenase-like cupin family protein